MKNIRTLTPIIGLLATAVYAFAQTPPVPPRPAAAPLPLAAPTPAAAPEPMPAAAPLAPMPPMAPMAYIDDWDLQEAKRMAISPDMQDKIEAAREQVERMKLDMRYEIDSDIRAQINSQVMAATDMAKDMALMAGRNLFAFAPQATPKPAMPGMPPNPPMPVKLMTMRMSDDRL